MNVMFGGMEAGKLANMNEVTSLTRMTKFVVSENHKPNWNKGLWFRASDFSLIEDHFPNEDYDTGNYATGEIKNGIIYYLQEKVKSATSFGNTINITAANFPGTYRLVGETYARSEKTGKDEYFQFEIPKAKMGAENTITLEAEGDPTVFNMTMKVLRPEDGIMMKLTQFSLPDSAEDSQGITKFITFIDPAVNGTGASATLDATKEINHKRMAIGATLNYEPAKTGYTFDGWYANVSVDNTGELEYSNKITATTISQSTPSVLYAKYTTG